MRPIDMAEFVGEEPISVGVDEPITFENKTDTAFDVDCGIVFRKSGLYRVSIVGGHMSVAVEPERKTGQWINHRNDNGHNIADCSVCGNAIQWFDDDMKPRYCCMCGSFNGDKMDE